MMKTKAWYKIRTVLIFAIPLCMMAGCDKHKASLENARVQCGILVDCARHYYPQETLKKLIDVLSEHDDAFLQLHLTDDENVGVECAYLGQTAESAELLPDGSYRNPQTGGRFYSAEQVAELLSYASEKGVFVIPEIDAPAHMGGFLRLAETARGTGFTEKIAAPEDEGELEISSTQAISFVLALYDEYAQMFQECAYFHIGCDEHFSGTKEEKTAYINVVSAYMEERGFIVRAWNDFFTKDVLGEINQGIQITYWSADGDAEDLKTAEERRGDYASPGDLCDAGFQILNYNSYYLYYVPSPADDAEDLAYMIRDLKENWQLGVFEDNGGTILSDTEQVIGCAVSLWSEHVDILDEREIEEQLTLLYNAMCREVE